MVNIGVINRANVKKKNHLNILNVTCDKTRLFWSHSSQFIPSQIKSFLYKPKSTVYPLSTRNRLLLENLTDKDIWKYVPE